MSSPKHILLVDDEPVTRRAVGQLLAQVGYVVEAVESAIEALARLEAAPFDLVLTDNNMPRMAGLEMASVVKDRWPSLPIVMFSGNPPQGPVPCLDAVLLKPDDLPNLLEAVKNILTHPSQILSGESAGPATRFARAV